jgi:hypothetical protein
MAVPERWREIVEGKATSPSDAGAATESRGSAANR